MFGRRKDVVYKVLSTKKRAVALHKLSAELETPAPALLKTVKELESEGLVEVFYGGVDKASIMVRAKTLEDYFGSEV
ncbi:hypothetical protein [Thermococcus peptonophilus]|uniref:hypothetical protein n=1 Tax=Thermococcus peptonophilus TaxID=53952 RepID=UPI0006D0B9BA